MAKRAHGHQRTIITKTRWSPPEYGLMVKRRERSGAKTDSDYLRRAAITGMEFQVPAFETLRDLRNEVINLAAVLESLPSGKLRDEALAEAKAALGRICR